VVEYLPRKDKAKFKPQYCHTNKQQQKKQKTKTNRTSKNKNILTKIKKGFNGQVKS
jgi:hypothetical protein